MRNRVVIHQLSSNIAQEVFPDKFPTNSALPVNFSGEFVSKFRVNVTPNLLPNIKSKLMVTFHQVLLLANHLQSLHPEVLQCLLLPHIKPLSKIHVKFHANTLPQSSLAKHLKPVKHTFAKEGSHLRKRKIER